MVEEGHLHQQVRHARLPPRRRARAGAGTPRSRPCGVQARPRSSSSLEERREVARRPLVKGRDIERRLAASVRRVDLRAVPEEHIDRFLVAQEGRRVQGRPAVPVGGVHVRASTDEQLDGLRLAGDRRPHATASPPRSGSTASTAAPLAMCRSMAPRSPARAAAQMFDVSLGRGRAAGLPRRRTTSRGWRPRS